MIRIHVGVDDLAALRFTTDAVWEITASLNALWFPRQHALHTRLRSLIPRRPVFDLELLRDLTSHPHWIPDTLGPPPTSRPAEPAAQIAALVETPDDVATADLEMLSRQRPGSRLITMTRDQFLHETVAAMTGYWHEVLEPIWQRVLAVTDADIAYRAIALAQHGAGQTVSGLHPELEYHSGTVSAAMTSDRTIDASGHGVWFVPSVFRWPWLSVGTNTASPVVSYAAHGPARVWEPAGMINEVLARLLGRSRAAILGKLDVPRTTTGLARDLGLDPGTVSSHLGVLKASGLITNRRHGREVHYEQTTLGTQLVVEGGGPGDWIRIQSSRHSGPTGDDTGEHREATRSRGRPA